MLRNSGYRAFFLSCRHSFGLLLRTGKLFRTVLQILEIQVAGDPEDNETPARPAKAHFALGEGRAKSLHAQPQRPSNSCDILPDKIPTPSRGPEGGRLSQIRD